MSATPHDSIYKQVFSHPQVVEALLRGFVHEDWVAHIDLATLEKANNQYVSEELLQRSNDVIWRVQLHLPDSAPQWLYLYLVIEFQSRNDPWMALRLLSYVCLLYQDLIKSGQVRQHGGKLPPVFPIVIYNGKPKWRASLEMASLVTAPGSLSRWSPRFRYRVLDEGRVPEETLARAPDNLLAHLIALETCRPDSPAVQAATQALGRYFQRFRAPAYDSLSRAVMVFYQRVVFAKLDPGKTLEEFRSFEEIEAMYATRIEEWNQQIRQEGLQAGRQEGRQDILLRQLTRRFGPLGTPITQRLQQASFAELEQWADNILDARTLEDVFRMH